MDLAAQAAEIRALVSSAARAALAADDDHIVDQLIRERAVKLSRHATWPLLRPLLYAVLHYREAVGMADHLAGLGGADGFAYLSRMLALDVAVRGAEHIPAAGAAIFAPNHPTGLADGVTIHDALAPSRGDLAVFANRDALRVSGGFRDVIIPVEWRAGEKTHQKSRDTLMSTVRAFDAGKAVVLFPSGRLAHWHEGALTERPWQGSVAQLGRRYEAPIVPVHIAARNSPFFYGVSRLSTELRDMTLFHELLNKKGRQFTVTFGAPIMPDALPCDPSEAAARLRAFVTERLSVDPKASFG